MVDFRETRSSVARWKEILIPAYRELVRLGVGDVWVFGSQAVSLYLPRPLASKDLDLLASGMTIGIVETICAKLISFSGQKRPYYTLQNLEHNGRSNPVFSIYLSGQNEKPFAIEIFQTYNGHDLKRLTPYAAYLKRWGVEFQTLTVEAIIATRLAFRPPERISSFNAYRLNRFIQAFRRKVDWNKVEDFTRDFQLERTIDENLKHLAQYRIEIIDSRKLSFISNKTIH